MVVVFVSLRTLASGDSECPQFISMDEAPIGLIKKTNTDPSRNRLRVGTDLGTMCVRFGSRPGFRASNRSFGSTKYLKYTLT